MNGSFVRLEFRTEFVQFVKAEGFAYVTLDMEGYRSGSMNEILKTNK